MTNSPFAGIGPLLEGSYHGLDAAGACLMQPALRTRIRSAARLTLRQWAAVRLPLDDLEQEICVRVLRRVRDSHGLPMPSGNRSAERDLAWTMRVFINAARDALRHEYRRTGPLVLERAHESDSETSDGLREGVAPEGTDDAVMGAESVQELGRVLDQIVPTHALAWIALRLPSLVSRERVQRASEYRGKGVTAVGGVLREGDELWERWTECRDRFIKERSARLTLAWLMRSSSTLSPESWFEATPDQARKGMETVGRWERRGHAAVVEGLSGGAEPPTGEGRSPEGGRR